MTRKTRIQPMTSIDPVDDDEAGERRPSKSQMKRDMHALQALGTTLVELPKDALKRMPMPEELSEAVLEARRITDHEGKRRQLQYIGRIMRTLDDADTAALRAALEVQRGESKAETARLHWIERTREQLLADDDAFTDFLRKHPGAEAQTGRTLIRNARKEAQQSKPPRYYRELFQWIKAVSEAPAEPAPEHDDDDSDA